MSTSCWDIQWHSPSLYCNFISLVPTALATIFCMILVRLFLFIHFSQAIRAELFSTSYISRSVWIFQLAWSIFLPVVGNDEGLLSSTLLLFFLPWRIQTNQSCIWVLFCFVFLTSFYFLEISVKQDSFQKIDHWLCCSLLSTHTGNHWP